jgi:hypothetical protein
MAAAYTKRLSELFDSCYRASAAKIADCRFGKVLLGYLEELGLVELAGEGIARVVHSGDPFSDMWIKTWQRIDGAVIDY